MIGHTNRGHPTSFLIGLLTVAIVIFSISGCKGDKSRRGDPGALPPLGSKGEESARVSGKNLEESLNFYKKSLVVLLRLHGEANALRPLISGSAAAAAASTASWPTTEFCSFLAYSCYRF